VKIAITPSNLAKVRQAVGALPDEERAVLLLVCSGGLSYCEAADKLRISQNELKTRLLHARLAFMESMSALSNQSKKKQSTFRPVAEVTLLNNVKVQDAHCLGANVCNDTFEVTLRNRKSGTEATTGITAQSSNDAPPVAKTWIRLMPSLPKHVLW
jgi:predicted DNA-binding protein (UPF0251 family)